MSASLPEVSPGWEGLRQAAASAGRVLTMELLEQAWALFCQVAAGNETAPAQLTREYGRQEYLLVVGADGEPGGGGAALVQRFSVHCAAHSQFGLWFQLAGLRLEEDLSPRAGENADGADEAISEPVLLAARWLCHLVGLRHRTVEIFLDLPGVGQGLTLVQVRGMDKVEAPGAFDIPCAGHASETETTAEALRHELSEELNLAPEDLDGLRLVARYVSPARSSASTILLNEEYRYLFRARIKPGAAGRIAFRDGEVAGLALVNFAEMTRLALRFPERIASGLGDALGYYRAGE
jgi:isopentenyldiphosphate isomerase